MHQACRTCGCDKEVHQHYRDGTDCGRCGRAFCPAFRPLRWYHALLFRPWVS